MMRLANLVLSFSLGAAVAGPALAQDAEFEPERLTVEERIRPGPNVYVFDQNWKGASRLNILSADDLSVKGNISIGLVGQATFTPDFGAAYLTSVYARRIMRGPIEAALEEYDPETLKLRREIPISAKMAQVASDGAVLRISEDGKFAYVQNATPATSISVVDLAAGREIAEIPTPGCFAVFPAAAGAKFTTLCGDGSLVSFAIAPDGSFSQPLKSAKIFDADTDALFLKGLRVGSDLLFLSFNGNLYRVSDSGEVPALVEKTSLVEGIEGDWRPGGVGVMTYNPAHDVLFVAMHPGGKEGSHKDAATEVWAVKLGEKRVLYRSAVHDLKSISVTAGERPVLFGASEEGAVSRYEIDPEAKFAAKVTASVEDIGIFTPMILAGP